MIKPVSQFLHISNLLVSRVALLYFKTLFIIALSCFFLFFSILSSQPAQSQLNKQSIIDPANQAKFRTSHMPYTAFDKLNHTILKIDNATLKVGFAPGKLDLSNQQILNWITNSAEVVSKYYGQFPVNDARVLIVPAQGKGVKTGQAFGYRGAAIRVFVGEKSDLNDLKKDWIAIHEMIHLALPNTHQRHLWLAEGLSVYVESISRVQAGQLTEAFVWNGFMKSMPFGLPKEGDKGLDYTHTWGRTYWGGAIFCLLADIEIRQQTNNKMGLQDALIGLIKKGGNNERIWSISEILEATDYATGKKAVYEQYMKMYNTPMNPDLEKIWKDLGVTKLNGKIVLDNNAPLAKIRQAIFTPRNNQ